MNSKDKAIRALNKLLNKKCSYGNSTLTPTDWDINEQQGRFYIYFQERHEPMDRPLDEAHFLVNEFKPIQELTRVAPVGAALTLQSPAMLGRQGLQDQLLTTMLDSMELIKQSKDNIPQADAIMNGVKTIIDLAKTDVAYQAIMLKQQRGNDL